MITLYRKHGSRYRAANEGDILDAAAAIVVSRARGTALTKPVDAADVCRALCEKHPHERFVVVYLDTRHRVLEAEAAFNGTIDGCTVAPRVIVKRALELNAAAAIIAHQHPSGVAEPSEADVTITFRLSHALALVDIRLLDHLLIAADETVSFAEKGLLR